MPDPMQWTEIIALAPAALNTALITAYALGTPPLWPTESWEVLMPLVRQARISQVPETDPHAKGNAGRPGWRYTAYSPTNPLLYETLWVPMMEDEGAHREALARLALWHKGQEEA